MLAGIFKIRPSEAEILPDYEAAVTWLTRRLDLIKMGWLFHPRKWIYGAIFSTKEISDNLSKHRRTNKISQILLWLTG